MNADLERLIALFSGLTLFPEHMRKNLDISGRAGLTLLDENDPLESGIEIVAQVPNGALADVAALRATIAAQACLLLLHRDTDYYPDLLTIIVYPSGYTVEDERHVGGPGAGRFDRRIVVNRPDVKGREEILRVHSKRVKLAEDVDLAVIVLLVFVGLPVPGFIARAHDLLHGRSDAIGDAITSKWSPSSR